ncbi:hypothetical protein V8F20_007368 [Naviculisporaceae sp. PSN 640]
MSPQADSDQSQSASSKPAAAGGQSTTGRILACALCKQRRVKCTRSFPCENCVRAGVQCVQPTVQQRRRRFAERALLDRIQSYEGLLRNNNIPFEPLHGYQSASVPAPVSIRDDDSDPGCGRGSKEHEARDVWLSIKRVALEDDDDDEGDSDGNSSKFSNYEPPDRNIAAAIQSHDHLLFGAPNPNIHLPSMHPAQVQIFKLWQVYLDNVNPLLKVTHVPSLQARIIDAASHVDSVSPPLEALMFSIYSIAVRSMTDEECIASFHLPQDQLLSCYQVACKQALVRCTPWRSNDRDCLTALYLYLLSVGQQVDPRSLACMASVAIRIAQRMGLPYEPGSSISGCKTLEFEMRRRLWWSLVIFDNRLCEIVNQEKSTSLSPTWDCRVPLNINDFELRTDMKKPPATHEKTATESLFVVVWSELANFVRRSITHLDIIGAGKPSPEMVKLAKQEGGELRALEEMIESKYLAYCNPEVPLHHMTMWSTRSFFARARLVDHYLTYSATPAEQLTEAQRGQGFAHAIRMLECDTKIRTSPLTQGYLWHIETFQCPVLAYLHVLHGLAKRPGEEYADKAWIAVCENYESLVNGPNQTRSQMMFALKFSPVVMQGWEARQTLRRQRGQGPEEMPQIVLDSRIKAMQMHGIGPSEWSSASSGGDFIAADLFPNLHTNIAVGGGQSPSVVFPSALLPGGPSTPSGGRGGQEYGGAIASTMGGPFFGASSAGQGLIDTGMGEQFWSDDAFKFV